MSQKQIVWMLFVIVFAAIFIAVERNIAYPAQSMEKIEYRTDVQPLQDRFGNVLSISSCYWKAVPCGRAYLGPTSYRIRGFVPLDEKQAKSLLSKYSFVEKDIEFEKGISPSVTGFGEFEWKYSADLSKAFVGYIGKCYLDFKNYVLYFEFENT